MAFPFPVLAPITSTVLFWIPLQEIFHLVQYPNWQSAIRYWVVLISYHFRYWAMPFPVRSFTGSRTKTGLYARWVRPLVGLWFDGNGATDNDIDTDGDGGTGYDGDDNGNGAAGCDSEDECATGDEVDDDGNGAWGDNLDNDGDGVTDDNNDDNDNGNGVMGCDNEDECATGNNNDDDGDGTTGEEVRLREIPRGLAHCSLVSPHSFSPSNMLMPA